MRIGRVEYDRVDECRNTNVLARPTRLFWYEESDCNTMQTEDAKNIDVRC